MYAVLILQLRLQLKKIAVGFYVLLYSNDSTPRSLHLTFLILIVPIVTSNSFV